MQPRSKRTRVIARILACSPATAPNRNSCRRPHSPCVLRCTYLTAYSTSRQCVSRLKTRTLLTLATLSQISVARLDDAKALMAANRHDGSMYLRGYSVEMSLKESACRALGWSEFPSTEKEFEGHG